MKNNTFYAMLSRMKYINRWGLMNSTRQENLSEHSLETAIIAHALALIGNKRLGKHIDADRVAVMAIFHDCSEIITGDMPTPIKYYNAQIKLAYKEIESAAADKLLSRLPEDLRQEYEPLFDEQENQLLHRYVKAADKLSALIKCIEELKMGNEEFKTAKQSITKSIEAIGLDEIKIFMEEFLPAYSLTLDEQ
ncbi:5'-deoxynucleotidase [Ruminococcus sp. zg-924]|uniref:5'-deoxynucleotidase n=1 Tax=Ruminococcus sp. zg-924 TaxID=2678505 RepID=UPI00210A87FD|nr:5'-deoxynucleotidase [Ruminococcus sp. zg-924]MCQ4023189.1 5'-deoxynucleotidase [Ruminococcus sp. zg-924]